MSCYSVKLGVIVASYLTSMQRVVDRIWSCSWWFVLPGSVVISQCPAHRSAVRRVGQEALSLAHRNIHLRSNSTDEVQPNVRQFQSTLLLQSASFSLCIVTELLWLRLTMPLVHRARHMIRRKKTVIFLLEFCYYLSYADWLYTLGFILHLH